MEDISKYLTVKDVAQKLGLTEEWIRDLIHSEQIKAVKIGRWRIKSGDLDKFIKSRSNVK